MEILGTRYVVGRTLDLDGPGAVIQVRGRPSEITALAARLAILGPYSQRKFANHVALGVRCTPDVVEAMAEAMASIAADPAVSPNAARRQVDKARRANWARLREVAVARYLPTLVDDEGLSIGLGASSATFGLLAHPRSLGGLGRIPVALVTGTNGKTTTSRFVAAMAELKGWTVGLTSSDGMFVGGTCLERGDWSGPGAARRVLRHGRVTCAVLETARGGMLRRGVQVDCADVAVITNVSADHLGEWGVETVDDMAEVKLLIADGLREGGALVLNADNWRWPELLTRLALRRPDLRIQWFSRHRPADACVLAGQLVVKDYAVMPVDALPLGFGGRAAHNIENALAAALVAVNLGIPPELVGIGLRSVTPDPEHSAGRANLFEVPVGAGSATVFVDFAHNPEGVRHLAALAMSWKARRRLLVFGQAGDRTDAILDATSDAAIGMRPFHVFLKEMVKYQRGRAPGEVVSRLAVRFAEASVPTSAWPDELAATDAALAALAAGDFLLILAHTDPEAVVAKVRAAALIADAPTHSA